MAQFKKKPVVIDAMQFTGSNAAAVLAWAQSFDPNDTSLDIHGFDGTLSWGEGACIIVSTLEGQMQANPGDYLIRGVKGEFYPCKPDIFAASYDAV